MQPRHHDRHAGAHGNIFTDLLAGAVAGAVAVWVMDRIDWFDYRHEDPQARERTQQVRPGGMAPAQVVAARVAGHLDRPIGSRRRHSLGLAVHYTLGMGPGALYAALRDRYPIMRAGHGALFGLGLFVVQDELLNSVTGLAAKPDEYPWQAHARGLIAHVVYGVATETLVNVLAGSGRAGPEVAQTREITQPREQARDVDMDVPPMRPAHAPPAQHAAR